jgi:hypothetical protein
LRETDKGNRSLSSEAFMTVASELVSDEKTDGKNTLRKNIKPEIMSVSENVVARFIEPNKLGNYNFIPKI